MTSTITQPVNGFEDPISAKDNVEGFVIVLFFLEEYIFINREVYILSLRHTP